jgi:putative flippase GtrA
MSTRLARFIIVGVGAAALLFVLIIVFAELGLSPFAGSVVAYAIAFVVAYSAQWRWTFRAQHRHGDALPRYFAVQAGCALLSGLSSHLAVIWLGASPLVMSALTTVSAGSASYLLSTLWVFPERLAQR